MAGRCGCTGAGGCSCLIVDSDTVTRTGTGSTGSPFQLHVVGGAGGGGTFSYQFTVPDADVFDDVKISLNQPMPGMIAVNLFDVGVIGDPAKILCMVYDHTDQVQLTDWGPFGDFANGVVCGSATTDHDIEITVYGPWSVA